jgi:branched-chain amino acid transport system substrate-binding protein
VIYNPSSSVNLFPSEKTGLPDRQVPRAVVKALEQTDMQGAAGRIRFGKDHQAIYGFDPKEGAVGCGFQWVKPGKRVIVFPETFAEAKIQLPDYMK